MSTTLVSQSLVESFVIDGGHPLNGRVRAAGNKNAALPIIAACLLTDEPVTLSNVPSILDVAAMLELATDIGVDIERLAPGEIRVHAAETPRHELDEELCRRIRASVLFAGPLLARCGHAVIPPPGGDVIGRRRLDVHMHAFERLGAGVQAARRFILDVDQLRGAPVFLEEASVTGT